MEQKRRDRGTVAQAMHRLGLSLLAAGFITIPRAQELEILHGRHYRHRRLALAGVALFVIAGVWLGGNAYGMRYSIGETRLRARSTDADLRSQVQQRIDHYRLRIRQSDGMVSTYHLQDVGVSVDVPQTVAAAHALRSSWLQRVAWWRPMPLTITVTADDGRLQTFITEHALVTLEEPKDASISIEDGQVRVQEGKAGRQFGVANPVRAILSAASQLRTAPLAMQSVVKQPVITAASLHEAEAKLRAILAQPVTITVGDAVTRPDAKTIGSWIVINPAMGTEGVRVTVNQEAVRSYVESVRDDVQRPSRSQVSYGGQVVVAGAQGVTVGAVDDAVTTLVNQVATAKGVAAALPVRHTGAKTIQAPTSGKWIEVDLSTKRMYVYSQNSLQRTLLVSAGAPATPTVTGTYAIFSKFSRQTMTGANADGSRYVQPNVPWVNYFYRDYAIHGNYWRPTGYFGNVNSSHGCVGLMPDDAAWIYNWAPVGTPVVIHY